MATVYDSGDPTAPNYKNKLIASLMGSASGEQPGQDWSGANLPGTPATPPPQTTGSTTQPGKVEGGLPPIADTAAKEPTFDASGFDPSNPIDAIFIKNHYKDNGPGSGFGDKAYWRAHPDQAARLDEDQRGVGHDTPGPGDVGNTSDGSNAKMFAGGGGGGFGGLNALGLPTLAGTQGNDPADSILARIMAALTQYGG